MDRILILDGNARCALAVVRSLGRLDVELGVAASSRHALAWSSRFAHRRFACPDPAREGEAFQDWLQSTVDSWKPHMLLPLTDVSLERTLELETWLRARTALPFVEAETVARISDKAELVAAARNLGVRTPRTLEIPPRGSRDPDLDLAIEDFSYPAVLKTARTQSMEDGCAVRHPVYYPDSAEAVRQLIDSGKFSRQSTLLQQRIEGPGVGVFATCVNGRAVCHFAHRRLLEKPPSGGVSVLSQSLSLERAPIADADRLLAHFRWQGVAMVEFKQHTDGRYYLMEINPRFWGTLQLAIDSGRDFPVLLYRLFRSGDPLQGEKLERLIDELPQVQSGRRLRWFLGTVDHLLLRMRSGPWAALRKIVFRNDLSLLRYPFATRLEVLRLSDPGPFWAELRAWFAALGHRGAV
ncbi:ATP-grasp domain-containing protein [Myxococcota bacterium]|nr:ATP-grasp domain-containing protein [Myxococcota bacterium]